LYNNNDNNRFNITINEEVRDQQHQNVTFSDQTPQWSYTVDSMPDSTFGMADASDADLGSFFSRPIKIAAYPWAVNQLFFVKFNPWNLFFTNPRVMNRITNFNLLRCKLHVRIVLNGNGFYYGRAIASYIPLHTHDEFTRDRAFFIQDVVAASQRPHVYLDPTYSQGGTIQLPFVWYKNALNIPLMEWDEMGTMVIHGIQNLKNSNGNTDPITVSVFAWAEDVSLSIPTCQDPGALTPQLKEVFVPQAKDEYGMGIVSRPASMVARAAGALSNAPVIGMYARATELAARAIGGIATIFGYSRPVELAPIVPYKPTLIGNLCNTNVSDTSQKLTLDVKQELTIDPRVMGLGDSDEMDILSVAMRESWLTSFAWPLGEPIETPLWHCEVSPVLWNELNSEIHMPACCFAAMPFRRWKGTMKYRFQFVASAFHKGRIKIVYEPFYPTTNEYNTNYLRVVDLAKERDFTVSIGWGSELALLNHRQPGQDTVPYTDGTPLFAPPTSFANGVISVYVVNELTAPTDDSANGIEVNVFVSVGEDFEVYDPDSAYIENYVFFDPDTPPTILAQSQVQAEPFEPQSGEEVMNQPDSDLTKAESEPIKSDVNQTLATQLPTASHLVDVYYGDPIASFRQCLKRYTLHTVITPPDSTASATLITLKNSNFPYYRGNCPGAVDTSAVGGYNYCKATLMNYVTAAYTCRRGGIRRKYVRVNGFNDVKSQIMMVTRVANLFGGGYSITNTSVPVQNNSNSNARHRFYSVALPHTWDGTFATVVDQNPVCEVEIPYYFNVRFSPGKQANWTSDTTTFRKYHRVDTIVEAKNDDPVALFCFVAAGEDFNLGFFTGAPVMYYVSPSADPASG
jgi:hypothetical protein